MNKEYYHMESVTIKLDHALYEQLDQAARKHGANRSAVVREALRKHLRPRAGSDALNRFGNLVGCSEGPADLSTNPSHLNKLGQ